jgi:ATP-dependent Clp protease ATP-binding subunit ClpA
MSLFDTFSPRSRRAIFRAHSHAHEEQAAEITTEHLLLGLLHEDPELFILLMRGNREIVGSIEKDLTTMPRTIRAKLRARKLQLSKGSKEIIRVAAREHKRLGHTSVATQHLLLALLICPEDKRSWFGRTKKQNPSFAGKVLADNGLSVSLLESETKIGIITPQAFALNDRGQLTQPEGEVLKTDHPGEDHSQ